MLQLYQQFLTKIIPVLLITCLATKVCRVWSVDSQVFYNTCSFSNSSAQLRISLLKKYRRLVLVYKKSFLCPPASSRTQVGKKHFPCLQKSLQVLALSVADTRLGIGIIKIISSITSTARSLILFGVAPVLVLFLVMFHEHQRREQGVATAASVKTFRT